MNKLIKNSKCNGKSDNLIGCLLVYWLERKLGGIIIYDKRCE